MTQPQSKRLVTQAYLSSLIGAPSGLAPLDGNAQVPLEYLPDSIANAPLLPSTSGAASGSFLATDGSAVYWISIPQVLPDQAGHSGAVLSTDGSVASWQQPASALPPSGPAMGDLAGSYPAPTLATTGVQAATYGTVSAVPSIVIDAKGRAISASSIPIQITESQITGLATDLASKAPLASPAFSGAPTAPTAGAGDSSTKIATTAFVSSATAAAVSGKAPLASPAFSGAPTAPTAAANDNSTRIATTAFVMSAVAASGVTLRYRGTWNPATNTPTLSATGHDGELYQTTAAGYLPGSSTAVTANRLIACLAGAWHLFAIV